MIAVSGFKVGSSGDTSSSEEEDGWLETSEEDDGWLEGAECSTSFDDEGFFDGTLKGGTCESRSWMKSFSGVSSLLDLELPQPPPRRRTPHVISIGSSRARDDEAIGSPSASSAMIFARGTEPSGSV